MHIPGELGYNLIRKAYKYIGLNEEDHGMMNDTIFKGVKTDSILRTLQECKLSIPKPEIKAHIWELLTNPKKA